MIIVFAHNFSPSLLALKKAILNTPPGAGQVVTAATKGVTTKPLKGKLAFKPKVT
jgi:hypothetical protein